MEKISKKTEQASQKGLKLMRIGRPSPRASNFDAKT